MSIEEHYASPQAELATDSAQERDTRALYHAQNGVLGVVVAALVALLMAILWSEASTSNQYVSLAFFALTGFAVGGAIRYTAKAVTRSMRYVGLAFQLASCFIALFIFGVPVVASDATPFLIVLMLWATGVVVAFKFSHRPLDDEQQRLVWREESMSEVTVRRMRNRGWVIVCASIVSFLAIAILAIFWLVFSPY